MVLHGRATVAGGARPTARWRWGRVGARVCMEERGCSAPLSLPVGPVVVTWHRVGAEVGRGHLTILSFGFWNDFILNSFGFELFEQANDV